MAAAASKAKKKSYKVTNWREYNESLVRRGDITFWFSEDVLDAWEHDNGASKVGRPFVYSDLAIETLLVLRELFRLPYRQTEGLGRALVKLLDVDAAIPHHTSLVKRAGKMGAAIDIQKTEGPLDVVVDSTGLKVYGEGEWKVRAHGVGKRRTWRKLHLSVDPNTHRIVAHTLTGNSVHDADQVEPLLDQVEAQVDTFSGDGAYDQWKVYDSLAERDIVPIIPPRKNAKIRQHGNSQQEPLERDEAIRDIRAVGRAEWKREIGYHKRSLAETAMSRMKTAFGDRLKNRKPPGQRTEAALRCKLLNWFVALGMPLAIWG